MVGRRVSHQGRARAASRTVLIAVLCLMLVVTAGLVGWWWTVVMRADPIDTDPVQAQAVVISSPSCTEQDDTAVIRYLGVIPGGSAELHGCGFTAGQHIIVEYLAGSPKTARLAGTATAGVPDGNRMLLPIAIAASGLIALVVAGLLLADRRRQGSVSVADLQRRLAAAHGTDPGDGSSQIMTGRRARRRHEEATGRADIQAEPGWTLVNDDEVDARPDARPDEQPTGYGADAAAP